MTLQVFLITLLSFPVAKAANSTHKSFSSYQINQTDGPYSIQVQISNATTDLYFVIDVEKYIAVNGTCYLNSSVHFAFPCPIECSPQGCLLHINLPDVSFLGRLIVKTNETHYDVYYHQPDMCGMRRPVFTQENGPFIFTSLLPRAPWLVLLDDKEFAVDAEKGICKMDNSLEAFKCTVSKLAEFSRITIFLPEIENIDKILIGARSTNFPDKIYWISVERISYALSEARSFIFEHENTSSSCTNEDKLEISWRLKKTSSRINAAHITCFSNEEDLCGLLTPCVLEEKDNYSILKLEVTQGEQNIAFFTCTYENANTFDLVSYRYLWPGLDAFEGEDKILHTNSNIAELRWTVKSWSPREYRTLECSTGDRVLCSGLTTSFQDGRCHVNEESDTFTFSLSFERIGKIDKSVFVCNSADDSQMQTVYWHGTGYEAFNEHIPEIIIPIDVTALAMALRDYLAHARTHVQGDTNVFRISRSSTFSVTCSIDYNDISWSCVAHFKEAGMQLLMRRGTQLKYKEIALNGKSFKLSGKFEVCEHNASAVGKLETKHLTLINATSLDELHTDSPLDRALIAALVHMLSKGPKPVCRFPF